MPDNVKELYDALIKDGYTTDDIGTENIFRQHCKSESDVNSLYGALTKDGYTADDLGSLNQFKSKLGVTSTYLPNDKNGAAIVRATRGYASGQATTKPSRPASTNLYTTSGLPMHQESATVKPNYQRGYAGATAPTPYKPAPTPKPQKEVSPFVQSLYDQDVRQGGTAGDIQDIRRHFEQTPVMEGYNRQQRAHTTPATTKVPATVSRTVEEAQPTVDKLVADEVDKAIASGSAKSAEDAVQQAYQKLSKDGYDITELENANTVGQALYNAISPSADAIVSEAVSNKDKTGIFDQTIAQAVQERNDIWEKYNKDSQYADVYGGPSTMSIEIKRQADAKLDPDRLTKKLTDAVTYLHFNDQTFQGIMYQAQRYGMEPDDYYKTYVVPKLQQKLMDALDRFELEQYMPKSSIDYVMNGVSESLGGMFYDWLTKSGKQNQYKERAMQMTEAGMNPNYQAGTGAKIARQAVSLISQAPEFALGGSVAGAATKKIAGNAIERMVAAGMTRAEAQGILTAELASKFGQRLGQSIAQSVVSGAVNFGVLEGTSETARQLKNYDVNDERGVDQLDPTEVLKKTVHGAANGAIFGTIGGAYAGATAELTGFSKILSRIGGVPANGLALTASSNALNLVNMATGGEDELEGKSFWEQWADNTMQDLMMRGTSTHTAKTAIGLIRGTKEAKANALAFFDPRSNSQQQIGGSWQAGGFTKAQQKQLMKLTGTTNLHDALMKGAPSAQQKVAMTRSTGTVQGKNQSVDQIMRDEQRAVMRENWDRLMQEPDLDAVTKSQLCRIMGANYHFNPTVSLDEVKEADDGTYYVDARDAAGMLNERHTFASKEEADDWRNSNVAGTDHQRIRSMVSSLDALGRQALVASAMKSGMDPTEYIKALREDKLTADQLTALEADMKNAMLMSGGVDKVKVVKHSDGTATVEYRRGNQLVTAEKYNSEEDANNAAMKADYSRSMYDIVEKEDQANRKYVAKHIEDWIMDDLMANPNRSSIMKNIEAGQVDQLNEHERALAYIYQHAEELQSAQIKSQKGRSLTEGERTVMAYFSQVMNDYTEQVGEYTKKGFADERGLTTDDVDDALYGYSADQRDALVQSELAKDPTKPVTIKTMPNGRIRTAEQEALADEYRDFVTEAANRTEEPQQVRRTNERVASPFKVQEIPEDPIKNWKPGNVEEEDAEAMATGETIGTEPVEQPAPATEAQTEAGAPVTEAPVVESAPVEEGPQGEAPSYEQARQAGEQAIKSDNPEAIQQINNDYELATRRVSMLFPKGRGRGSDDRSNAQHAVCIDILNAMQSGDYQKAHEIADSETLSQEQSEALHSYIDNTAAVKGMQKAMDEVSDLMVENMAHAVKQTADEKGNITYVYTDEKDENDKPKKYSIVSGDMNDMSGELTLRRLDNTNNPTDEVKSISVKKITRIEPQGNVNDMINQRTSEIRMQVGQYYNDIVNGVDFEPGKRVAMKFGDATAEVTVAGINDDGSINLLVEGTGESFTVSEEEARQMLQEAKEDGFKSQLEAEKAIADQRRAQEEAQRKAQAEAEAEAQAEAERLKNPANRLVKDSRGHYDFTHSKPEDVEEFLTTFGNDKKAEQAVIAELKKAQQAEQALNSVPEEEAAIDGMEALLNDRQQTEQANAAKEEAHRQTEFWKDQLERIQKRINNEAAKRAEEERMKRERARKARDAKYDKPINDAKKRLAGDDEALNILNDREPHTLEEAVAYYMPAGSLVRDNYKDRFGVDQLGVTGETGLSSKELSALKYFFGKEADGAGTITKLAEMMYEDWPESLRQLGDVNDIRTTIIDLLKSAQKADDITHLVDKNRIEQAEQFHAKRIAYEEAMAEHSSDDYGELTEEERAEVDRQHQESNPLGGGEIDEAPFSMGEVKTDEQIKKHNDEARSKGGVIIDSNSQRLGEQDRNMLNAIGRQLGRTIVVDPDLTRLGANGRASADGKVLSISPKIASRGDQALRFVVGHELTHLMKKGDKDVQGVWNSFVDMVKEAMGDDFAKEFDSIKKLYDTRFDEIRKQAAEKLLDPNLSAEERKKYEAQAKLKNLTDDKIQEEIVCDFVGKKIFRDKKFVKDLVNKVSESHTDSASIVKRMYDFINKVLDYLKALKHPTLSDRRAKIALERARDIWKDMYELTAAKQREMTGAPGVKTAEIANSEITDERYNDVDKTDDGTVISSENKLTGDVSYNLHTEENKTIRKYRKDWSASEYRNYWIDKQVKAGKITAEQGEYIKNVMQEKAELAREQAEGSKEMNVWNNAQISVDEKGRPMFTVVIPDDEYPINFGISLVCKRRRALDRVMRELASTGLINQLVADPLNIVAINQIIKEHNLEVGCDLCYVEARRFRSIPNADKFTASWNEMIKSLDPDGKFAHSHHNFGENEQLDKQDQADTRTKLDEADNSQLDFSTLDKIMEEERQKAIEKAKAEHKNPPKQPKSIRYRQAKFMKQHPESRRLLDRSDFVDAKGFENAHKKNRPVLALFNGTFGASNPKNSFGDTPYNGEILTRDKFFSRNKAFNMGGVRFQSFDDYVGKNWYDYMQAHSDMAIRELPAHTYSKEELCVKTWGLTGNKFNMSGVPDVKEGCPAGLDENGNYIFHEGYEIEINEKGQKKIVKTDRQTFPWDEALKIRSAKGYRDNCGTIVVGVSDEHIWKMQHDKNVDMIIGYHSSSLNPVVAHAMGGVGKFTDYTDIQNERYGSSYGDDAGKSLTKAMKAKVPNINLLMAPKDAGGQEMGAREAVEYYVRWCEDHDIIPKFDKFCCKRENDAFDGAEQTYVDENGVKHRVIDDGYYKHIAGFKIIAQDENGNEYDVPQHEVRMVLPEKGDAFGSFDELTNRGVSEWQDIHNRIEGELYKEDGKGIMSEISDRIINGSMVDDLHKISDERREAAKKAQEEKAKAEAVEDDQDSYAFVDKEDDSYRKKGTPITMDNFYASTKTDFTNISKGMSEEQVVAKWQEMIDRGDMELLKSPNKKSASQYLLDHSTGDIYRLSNHWGDVASCHWGIDSENEPNSKGEKWTIAKSNLSDFSDLTTDEEHNRNVGKYRLRNNLKVPETDEEVDNNINQALKESHSKSKSTPVCVGTVTPKQMKEIGDEYNGYIHTVNGNKIYANSKAQNLLLAKNPELMPVTEEDYKKIPDILSNFDTLKKTGHITHGTGNETISYMKQYEDGTIYYYEEIQTGKNQFAFSRLKKEKSSLFSSDSQMQSSASAKTSETDPPLSGTFSDGKDTNNSANHQENSGENEEGSFSFGNIPLENARQLSLFDENGEPKSTEQQVEDYKKLKQSRAYEQLSLFDKDGNPSADVTGETNKTEALSAGKAAETEPAGNTAETEPKAEPEKTNPIDDIIEKNEATAKAIEAPQDVAVDVAKKQAKTKKASTKKGMQDFGEKFGNARKDTARKGFKREGDFRPAWRKPYQFRNADEETAAKMNKYSFSLDKTEEETTFDASKPFVAYTEESVKRGGYTFARRTPITDANGKAILFHSEEEAEAAIPVFEAKRQGFTVREDKETHEYVICKSASTGKQVEYERFPSQEEAAMFLATPEGCKSLLNHKSNNYELPPIARVKREGMPDYRNGKDITPEQFMSEFGFRGGEFGNWVKDDERQTFLNVAYDSFRDLANVLHVSPKALSLGGKLGIAFGSRGGTGSTKGALAHYEPKRVVINMTKLKGAGSLAHEWAHALDNYFGLQDAQINRVPGDEQTSDVYLTEKRSWRHGTRREVRDIFKDIVKAMNQKTVTRAVDASDGDEVMGKLMKNYEADAKSTRNEFARGLRTRKYNRKTRQYDEILHKPTEEDLKKFDELTKQLATADDFKYEWNPSKQAWMGTGSAAEQLYELTKDVIKGSGRYAPLNNIMYYADKISRQRDKMKAAAANAEETVSVKTDMLRCAEFYDRDRVKPYWSTDIEMFARAFETYVNNKIAQEGKSSDYLCYDKHTVSSLLYKKSPYPGGEEYKTLEKLFDNLFDTIEERENEEGNTEMYSFGDIPEATHDDVKAQDQEYAEAVETGDTEKAKAMLQKKADELKAQVFAATDVPGYSVSKDYRPKKTIKVYKTFTVDANGKPSALFVANGDTIPVGVWLKAKDAPHFTNQKNGRQYVVSTKNKNTQGGATGVGVSMADISSEDIKKLIDQGALKPNDKGTLPKSVVALAYRPGWHAGDLPFFPQGGMQIEGSSYPNVHRYNQVVFECEMSVDQDYSTYHTNDAGQVVYEDRQEMPTRGSYKFATNPMAKAEDIGSWYIGGELKINRALTEQECNDILQKSGRAPQEWQQYQSDDARKADMAQARKEARAELKNMTDEQKQEYWEDTCDQKYDAQVKALANKDKSSLVKAYASAYKGILPADEAKATAKGMTADEIRNELESIYADQRDADKADFTVKATEKAYTNDAAKKADYQYQHTTGPLDLNKLNYDPTETDGGKKILDITYDNDGNLIPLSQRFQADVDDERYSFGDIPSDDKLPEQTEEQKAMQAETDAALARKRNQLRPGDSMADVVRKVSAQREADNAQRLAEIRRENKVQKGDTMADIVRKQNAIKEAEAKSAGATAGTEAEQDSYSLSKLERAQRAYEREKARKQKEIDEKQKALRQKLVDQLTFLINDKHLTVLNRSDLNRMLKNIQNADEKNLPQMLAQGRTLVHHLTDKSQQKEIERLLKLKTQDVNGKNMSIAKNVSDPVRRIMNMIQGRLVDLKATGYDEDMTQIRRQNIFINAENKRIEMQLNRGGMEPEKEAELRQKLADNKTKYEANLQSLRDLTVKRDEARAQQATEGEEDVNASINELMQKMDKAVRGNATWTTSDSEKLTGLQILQIKQQADSQRKDIGKLNRQLEDLEDSLKSYEREARKPQRYIPVQRMEQLRQQIASMKDAIAMANDNLISTQDNVIQTLNNLIEEGKDSLYNKVENEKSRKFNLLHGMLGDIQGDKVIPVSPDDRAKTHKEGKLKKFFSAQLHSFEYLAKRINETTLGEDGWFYKYFVKGKTGVLQAENEYQEGMRDAVSRLDEKAKEIYGKSFNDAANLNAKVDYHPGVYIYMDRAGMPVQEEVPLSKSQAMYLYMVWKMPDGKMKLQLQGFTDESMRQVEAYIGDNNKDYADWLQTTFLADQRAKYNDRYVEMYNTSMANIDNYVPLKIDSDDVRRETDISEESGRRKTLKERAGSLINRTINTHRVDWTHGAFDVIAEHVKQMEEWNAFARVRRDLDYVLSNTYVRNQLDANSAGRYKQLYDASAIAAHSYTPPEAKYMDDVVGWLTKGLVGGNIAYRYTTAMKQMLSVPAFYGYSHDPRYLLALTKNIGIQYTRNLPAVLANMATFGISGKANFKSAGKGGTKKILSDNIVWCMQNVPSFRKRVLKGTAGMEFMDEQLKGTAGKIIDKYLDYGMATNQMIDAVTCSIGIKTIFDYKYGKAEKAINADKTLTADQKQTALDEARRVAINDADRYYNQTQQSNHVAFMSPMQMSRSMIDRALSVYQNASIGYARKGTSAAEDLWKMRHWDRLKKVYKEQYLNDNPDMTPEEADKMANSYLRQQATHHAIGVALYYYLMNWLWDWGGRGLLGLFQGDQDEKDKRIAGEDDNTTLDMTRLFGKIAENASYPARGLTGMNVASGILNGNLSHPLLFYTEVKDLEDQAKNYWKDDDYAGIASEAFFKGLRIAGFDFKVWQNIVEGAYGLSKDACTANKDHDAMINLMFALNTPNSNRKAVAEEIYKNEDRDTYVRNILTAGKYTTSKYVALLPGMKLLTEKNAFDIYKEFELNKLLNDPNVKLKSAQKAQLEHYKTVDECQKAYDSETDPTTKDALGKKLLKLLKQEEKESKAMNADELSKKARESLLVKKVKPTAYTTLSNHTDVIEDEMLKEALKERKVVYDEIEELESEDPSSVSDYRKANKKELEEYERLKDLRNDINSIKRDLEDTKDVKTRERLMGTIRKLREQALTMSKK